MRLLIDTDFFWKLAVANLLADAVAMLGSSLEDCERLPALTHMLQRGKLRKKLGASCDALHELASSIPATPQPQSTWTERLIAVPSIDVGEALLFALAAENNCFVMTGDKRALAVIKTLGGLPALLRNKIVTVEATLIALCNRNGVSYVKDRIRPLLTHDTTIRVCFLSDDTQIVKGLWSYYRHLASEVDPLELWDPAR